MGLPKPVLPGIMKVPAGAPEGTRAIAVVCNRVYQRSAHLCQPSEAFDVRWEKEWQDLSADLSKLEELLRAHLVED